MRPLWLVLIHFSGLLFPQIILRAQSQDFLDPLTTDEAHLSNKRAWKDVSGSWGKRRWNDLEGAWEKRAWERMNGAWGKPLTLNPKVPTESQSEVDFKREIGKRPEWNKFKGSSGKMVPEGNKTGWSNLKGLWGKRGWENLSNFWGKRTKLEYTPKSPSGKQALHNLQVADGSKSE